MTEIQDLSDIKTAALVDYLGDALLHGCGTQGHYNEANLYLHELAARVDTNVEEMFVLPVAVSEAIRYHFGPGSRTFAAMTKRVRFSYKVWQGKYGPWTPEQAEYAEQVCLHAIKKGVELARAHGGPKQPYVYKQFDRALHHELTDAGFKRRTGDLINVASDIDALLAS